MSLCMGGLGFGFFFVDLRGEVLIQYPGMPYPLQAEFFLIFRLLCIWLIAVDWSLPGKYLFFKKIYCGYVETFSDYIWLQPVFIVIGFY